MLVTSEKNHDASRRLSVFVLAASLVPLFGGS